MPQSDPVFYIGTLPIHGNLILAPMDGYSDMPFRSICRDMGSAMSYTEFLSAIDIIHTHPHLHLRLSYLESERPVVFQLMDDSPERLVLAATKLMAYKPDVIDINLGCSARSVSSRGAGSGLLRTPDIIAAIFSALTKTLPVPVTAKIRLGWDETTRNYKDVVQSLQDNGAALIAVHARTRQQAYSGSADWDAIAEIKQMATIPIIGNGDVKTTSDIDRMLTHTRCDAVMIGRGAIGNPWIFQRLDRSTVSQKMVQETMRTQLARMLPFYGEEVGLRLFRKFAVRYLSPYQEFNDIRGQLLTCTEPDYFLNLLDAFLDHPLTFSTDL